MKSIFFSIFFLVTINTFSQVEKRDALQDRNSNINRDNTIVDEGLTTKEKKESPTIDKYKIISIHNDTIIADTSLTIKKDYKYNYLRKDDFELLPFHNIGQTFNSLGYTFDSVNLRPKFGAQARSFHYLEVDDIHHYHVPTPYTDLYFKTVLEQGQNLDALFTSNFTPRLNFFIAYKGLRSLGKYQNSLVSNGNFRIGFTYSTQNKRYAIKTHFTSQDFLNEENGGLTPTARQQYLDAIPESNNRANLDVLFEDAENKFVGRRFYADQHYRFTNAIDSAQKNLLLLKHTLLFKDKSFRYSQDRSSELLSPSLESENLNTEVEFQDVTNTLGLSYTINPLGKFVFSVSHSNFNYGYQTAFVDNNVSIPNRLTGDIVAIGGSYQGKIGKLELSGDIQYNVSGDFEGNYLRSHAKYKFSENLLAIAKLNINSRAANYNKLLHQSDYLNYNWFNDYNNVKTQYLEANLLSKTFGEFQASITQIQDYAYFGFIDNPDQESSIERFVKPFQFQDEVRYVKLKAYKEFRFAKFSLANTVMYQNVLNGQEVLRVPKFVTRQSIYYTDRWFKKALFLQTGISLKYFTSFNANAYDPILAEFVVQNFEVMDDFYALDFFFNIKVRQARVFLKYENFTTLFEDNNRFSAPNYPYRDAIIRFGLVWNFFL